jgi:hypothetical protein
VQEFAERIANGLLWGIVSGKTATNTISLIPTLYKMAGELEPVNGGSPNMNTGSIQISLSKTQNISAAISGMDSATLDSFLRANPEDKITILESMKNKALISVPAIEDRDIKIEAKQISSILKKTNTPMSAAGVVRLFGRNLAREGVDLTEVIELPKKMHEWERQLDRIEHNGKAAMKLSFKCTRCTLVLAIPKKEECINQS